MVADYFNMSAWFLDNKLSILIKFLNFYLFIVYLLYNIRPHLSILILDTYSVYKNLVWVCHTHFCNYGTLF